MERIIVVHPTIMVEPVLPADEYTEEFAKVKAVLRTAICHDIESAIHFAFMCTVPEKDAYVS